MGRTLLHLVDRNGKDLSAETRDAVKDAYEWAVREYPKVDHASVAGWAEELGEAMAARPVPVNPHLMGRLSSLASFTGESGRSAMRAVVMHEYGGPEKLRFEDDVPQPQVSGDTVLIATTAASVNPIDWKIRSGARQKDFPLSFPAILGRDVSGVVQAVGANVKHFKPGERVLALSNATYAELVAVDDSDVTHLPDGLDRADAAALPLIALTGDQLVRHATNVQKGQVVLITGALGSVGRAAVHSAKKIGAQVIAGVRGRQLEEAGSLGVAGTLAIDDDEAIEAFRVVDAIADIVGGEIAAKLIAKIKPGGSFGYTAVLPEGTAGKNPSIKITRVFAKPDPSKVREFADDLRDGKFVLPIGRRMPLRDAAEAHVLGQKGGIGKILLLASH